MADEGTSTMPALFTPLLIGKMQLQHRVAMAPMTRHRCDDSYTHTDLGVNYYSQRGSTPGTLLISEATFIDPKAGGYPRVSGCYSPDQIAAWKRIVAAVHANRSFMCLQLWAIGRVAELPELQRTLGSAAEIVSSGNIGLEGHPVPRPLTEVEIEEYIAWHVRAAKAFVEEAGGDCVEIHCANGYLLDQFLQTTANNRTDEFGGSAENRCRLPLAVVDAVVNAVGAERTGIRLSPFSTYLDMRMPAADIEETFSMLVGELAKRHTDLAYIHLVEARVADGFDQQDIPEGETIDFLYDIWTPRPLLLAGGLSRESALLNAEARTNSVMIFGRAFTSTPDLPLRLRHGRQPNKYDRDTFYTPGPRGYIDHPFDQTLAGMSMTAAVAV